MVKRYDMCHIGSGVYCMKGETDGAFVTHEDYAKLQSERDALANFFGEIKEIFGFKYQYFITSKGLVFSTATGRIKQLSPSMRGTKRNQYLFVKFEKNGKLENMPIHRMVAENFLSPKPSSEHVINHKDGNKHNNEINNLEWVTISENTRHAYRNGLAGGAKHGSFKGPVCAENDVGFGYVFFGNMQGEKLGFNRQNVSRAIKNPTLTHNGFRFSRLGAAKGAAA